MAESADGQESRLVKSLAPLLVIAQKMLDKALLTF